jgi:pSer/pThr/pTyr-binding forkhead associated (FHA) protein
MASLTLQLENGGSREYALAGMITIGRQSDNGLIIDNPAVSSHHACVFLDRDEFIVEDLQSTNGTFVNDSRVVRQTLHHGDVLVVGRQKLTFDQGVSGDTARSESEVHGSTQGETVFVDKQEHQRLLNIVMNAEARARDTQEAATVPQGRLGTLRVVAGPADRPEYLLEGHTSLIGRATWTTIRLKGWFKPRVAVAITRNQQGYVATLLRGRMLVNDQPMNGRHDLKDGDVIRVGGLTLAFSLKD